MKIQQAVSLLAARLHEQKVILFVGAGLSRASGLPGWKELFAPFCKELECPDEDDFPAAATAIIQEGIHNRKEIIDYIVKQIGRTDLELNPNHDLIKRLPFNIIITTNYDNLLEDLYGASKLKRIYSDESMAYFDPASKKKQLIYLHGDINHPEHMVVSSIDYQNFAEKRPLMVERLKTLLQDYTFLFTGYGANDPNLHAIFDYFRLTYKEDARRHFIVMPDPGKIKRSELHARFGIEPIILEDKTGLTAFLQELLHAYENPAAAAAAVPEQEEAEPEAGKHDDRDTRFVDDIIRSRTHIPPGFKPNKPFNVPGLDPHFTGRETEMALLEEALMNKQTVAVTGLFGMGGIGKTSLAKQVAHKLHNEGRFKDGVCWHRLEAKDLAVSLEELADVFGAAWLKEIKPTETQARYFQAMIQYLDILFVLDNAEYLENIPLMLELLRNHPTLITSRRRLTGLAKEIDLHRLDDDRAGQLFIKTWKQEDRRDEIEAIRAAFSAEEQEALRSICTGLLGNLPLAITIAAGVLRFRKLDIIAFQKLLAEKRLSLLQDPNNVYKTEEKDKNVRLSFDFSFDQLPAGGLAQSLFAVMGIFGGEDFDPKALATIFKEEKKEEIDSGVELLEQLSLVQVRKNRRLFLHPLLRQYALEKLPKFKGDAAYQAMAGYYIALVINNPQALHYEWQNALPFVDWCLAHSREEDSLLLIKGIDNSLDTIGRWTLREEWLKKGIDISNRLEAVSDLYYFTERLHDLYSRQGRYAERRGVIAALSDYCRRFKELEVNIPWINYKSAAFYLASHDMEQAYYANLQNMKESLFYGKKEEIGAAYQNLGNIYRRSGLFQGALRFYTTDLEIQEEFGILKENEIRAARDVCDIYLDLGKFTEALKWLKRFERELFENPNKELGADLYEKYFLYYLETGDVAKARDYLNKYKEAIEDFGLVTSQAKLIYYEGLLEKAAGRYQNSISSFEKALQFYRDFGREDESGKCFLEMGACCVKLGNNRKAREYLQHAGDIFKKYKINPISRCEQEAYYALLEARAAYDEQSVRLITRAKNTFRYMGVEDLRELDEIEAEIRRETGDDRFNFLLKQLKESGKADEIIDFGAGFLQVDPEQKQIVSPIDNREMILIPSGFIESPYYEYPLYLYPYYMDKYPVTNSDYKKFTDAMDMETPPHWPGGRIPAGMEDHPVVGITYDEALAYAQWAGKDLPLKEEWEIAAGIAEQNVIKEDKEEKDVLKERGIIYEENEEQQEIFREIPLNIKTRPIMQGKDASSPSGVCELLGNVFEYTQSFPPSSFSREDYLVLKGFSWLRPSFNKKNDISDGHYSLIFQRWADVGFRCVRRIFRKEDTQRFIDSGDKPADWEVQWQYERAQAQNVFDILDFLFYDGPKEPLIAKGINHCRRLLRLSPGHKRAVLLLTRFSLYPDDLSVIKDFFDSALYPLLEKEKEAAAFNFSRLREILSAVSALAKEEETIDPVKKLDAISAEIDRLLSAIEGDMLITGLKLTGRNDEESLEYLLARYEEKFSFFQYVLIQFLCQIKIKLAAKKESLAKKAAAMEGGSLIPGFKKVKEDEQEIPQVSAAGDSYTAESRPFMVDTAKQRFSLVNPYYTGRPIQDADMYFGRKDVLELIKNRLGPNNIIILYGQRRTGKTSTLYQLKNRVYKHTAVPVILDIQSLMGDDAPFLFYRMASELYDTIRLESGSPGNLVEPAPGDFKTNPQYKLEIFLKKAIQEVKGKPIIYLIDEFDGIFEMIKEKRVEPTVLDNLRSIMQHYRQVWFILAGTYLIKQEAANYSSALFNIATYEKISALEEKDARDLIVQPLQGRVEYDPYTVDKMISLTDCHPYFIQALCFEIVIYLEKRQIRRVTIEALQEVVDELLDRGSSHFDRFWEDLSKTESLVLSLLAENIREHEDFISLERIREICKGKLDAKIDIYKVIERLQERDLLKRREYVGKPHFGFFMELFKRWVSIYHPLESYDPGDYNKDKE